MKLLRTDARYELKKPLSFASDKRLIKLKAFLICAGNSHLLKGQLRAYESAYRLLNTINAYFKNRG